MSKAVVEINGSGLAEKAGRYLTFILGNESYGIPVLKVREIIRMIDITPVPRMPTYVKGVINLRGKVMPVIDLRLRFNLAKAEFTERTCTIVVQVLQSNGVASLLGLIVDAVEEVAQVTPESLEPAPDFGGNLNTDYIIAMARVKGGVKTLLDMDKIIAADAGEKIEVAA
jgi:purine-binding chemotaxis protein CheW